MKYPIEKMRACLALLPPPGGEVVAECLDEIESLRQHVTLLRDALFSIAAHEIYPAQIALDALSATAPRKRNADDMGNPPANAAEMLNAWKPKP